MNDPQPIFATSYFPPLALMAAMVQHLSKAENGTILIEQNETFPKQTYRNRTVIVTAAGPMNLSVPVLRPNGTHSKTSEIGISYAERWNINHWRAIETAYNSSPYFLYYRDGIEKILLQRHESLLVLNGEILEFLLKKMRLTGCIKYTTDYCNELAPEKDYRGKFSYKCPEELPIIPTYLQVFNDRLPFNSNVGVLDILFNLGPEAKSYLLKIYLGE